MNRVEPVICDLIGSLSESKHSRVERHCPVVSSSLVVCVVLTLLSVWT